MLGHVRDHFACKIFWKRLVPWGRSSWPRIGLGRALLFSFSSVFSRLIRGLRRLQFFEAKFQLLKLSGELFALVPEDHPTILLDHELQMLDLLRTRSQLLVLLDGLVMLRDQQRLQRLRIEPIETSRGILPVTVSIGGIALSKRATSGSDLLLKAQNALMQAKARGHDCFVEYRWKPTQQRAQRTVVEIGERVLKALRSDRAPLAFQPIVETATGQIAYYEALLRVLDDNDQPVSAAEFIPAVEQLGLARIIDRYVIERAVGELTENPDVTLSVNISGLTVADPLWLRHLTALLEPQTSLAKRLIIEITETVAMADVAESERFVRALRQFGCQVAIDDFGAGYTSFRHLKQLNVDIVKIDGSFVRNLLENRENQLFVRTLNDLANGFGLKTVAEFVETADEAALLEEIGIGFLQGYYFGRPQLGRIWQNGTGANDLDPPKGRAKRG